MNKKPMTYKEYEEQFTAQWNYEHTKMWMDILFGELTDMARRCHAEKPVAYEWHNHGTGHCYVDYIPRPNMDEKDGYTKTPLFKQKTANGI